MIYIYGNLNDDCYKSCDELVDKLNKKIKKNKDDIHVHLGFSRVFFDGIDFFKNLNNISIHTVFYIDINRPYEYTNENINLHYFPGFDNLILHDYCKYMSCIYIPKAKLKLQNNHFEKYDFYKYAKIREFKNNFKFKKLLTIGMSTVLFFKNNYNTDINLVNFYGTNVKNSKNNYCKDIQQHDIEFEHKMYNVWNINKILL